jgi:hypothetical protein
MEHDRFVDAIWLGVHAATEDRWAEPTRYEIHRFALE